MALTGPQDKRAKAINRIIAAYDGGSFGEDRTVIAMEIAELAPLGRAVRWHTAVAMWGSLVRNDDNPLRWAVLQGGIWACHANV